MILLTLLLACGDKDQDSAVKTEETVEQDTAEDTAE